MTKNRSVFASRLFILLHFLTLAKVSIASSPLSCPSGWTLAALTKTCYKVSWDDYPNYTWESARGYCRSLGSDLATFDTREEWDDVLTTGLGRNGVFIGYTDSASEGTWVSVNGASHCVDLWYIPPNQNDPRLPDGGTQQNCMHTNNGGASVDDYECNLAAENIPLCQIKLLQRPQTMGCRTGFTAIGRHCYVYAGHTANYTAATAMCSCGTQLLTVPCLGDYELLLKSTFWSSISETYVWLPILSVSTNLASSSWSLTGKPAMYTKWQNSGVLAQCAYADKNGLWYALNTAEDCAGTSPGTERAVLCQYDATWTVT